MNRKPFHSRLELLPRLRKRILCLSIFQRIAIGNSIIIIIGAIGGTLLTRHLAGKAADLWLIILFASLGITLSLLTNFWIIKTGLRPLHELRGWADRVQAGLADLDTPLLQDTDPDVRQLAAALKSMVNQLEERNLQLRALSERAINAQEEERKRIARSLHDDTGQALSTLIIGLERLEPRLPADQPDLRDRLESARRLATSTLENLRKVIYGLRPTILDDLGLVPAIRWYARSTLEGAGIRVELRAPDEPLRLSSQLTTTLFRITQEAIHNVARHARARSVVISLSQTGEQICLLVEDDGRGFDVARISGQALRLQRLGLLGIQERAELVGGEVTVESAPGRGTRVRVSVPQPPPGDGRDG